MCGKTSRVEAFLSLVKPFGVLESARTGIYFIFFCGSLFVDGDFDKTGVMAMPRTPIASYIEDDGVAADEGGPVDASLLPPGWKPATSPLLHTPFQKNSGCNWPGLTDTLPKKKKNSVSLPLAVRYLLHIIIKSTTKQKLYKDGEGGGLAPVINMSVISEGLIRSTRW
jgi:hypothetical protein